MRAVMGDYGDDYGFDDYAFGEAKLPQASRKHFDGVLGSKSAPIIVFIIEA